MASRKTSNQQRKRPECHTPDLTITHANIGDVINLDIKLKDYPVNPNKETNRMKAGVDLAGFERNCSSKDDEYVTDM